MKKSKLLALVLALVLALAPVTVFADGEAEAEKYDMDPTHLTFASQDDIDAVVYRDDGKNPGKYTVISGEDGAVRFTADISEGVMDPYVYVSFGKLATALTADDHPYCAVIYKLPEELNSFDTNVMQIFFMTKGAAPSEPQSLVSTLSLGDKYACLIFNPGSLTDWTGNVSAIRVDYFSMPMATGDTIFIHDILFCTDELTARAKTKAILADLNLPDELTLSFDMCGHGEQIGDQTVAKGALPVRPEDPTADGFVFDGWYTSKSYGTEFKFDAALDQETVTVFAKWAKANVISFESGEGSDVANQNVKRNGRAVEPAEPTREGYAFAGWYTDAEFTEKYDFNKLVKDSFTLYAKWVAVYDVKVNNGTASLVKAAAGTPITVEADPAPEGKKFDHWEFVFGGEFMSEADKAAKSESLTFLQTEGGCEITAVYVDAGKTDDKTPDDKTPDDKAAEPGDVNGDKKINAKDVTAIMKHIVGKTPEDFDLKAADFNGDTKINAKDVTGVMKRIVSGK